MPVTPEYEVHVDTPYSRRRLLGPGALSIEARFMMCCSKICLGSSIVPQSWQSLPERRCRVVDAYSPSIGEESAKSR